MAGLVVGRGEIRGVSTAAFYNRVAPTVLVLGDLLWNRTHDLVWTTRDWTFGTFFIYVTFLIVFGIFSAVSVVRADRPFLQTVKFLNRLPETGPSRSTLRILREQYWEFSNKKFVFDPSYYEKMLQALPDPIIVVDHACVIQTANESSAALLRPGDVVGANLFDVMAIDLHEWAPKKQPGELRCFRDLVTNFVFNEDAALQNQELSGELGKRTYWWSLTALRICNDENGDLTAAQEGADAFALSFLDIGEQVGQQKLLEEETEKHRSIISQILPPQIADQLLKDRRSVSKTVEKVAVAFCDIVSFTSWCGGTSAENVVKALNLMFKTFDEKLARYEETMTKIKCIGDCYMSAAGVFYEGADPAIVPLEMLRFCLDCIAGIRFVNAELGLTLRVRIGIAYGGPISAGVLGLHKPVFDIFGETVNDAQMMESSGEPMKVHIQAHMYEIVREEPVIFEEKVTPIVDPVTGEESSRITYLVTRWSETP
jgi:class 3 adenylate cyclase/PAS domain-containing protein